MQFRFLGSLALLVSSVHAGDDGNSNNIGSAESMMAAPELAPELAPAADSSSSSEMGVGAEEGGEDRVLTVPLSASASASAIFFPGGRSCDWYNDCYSCLSNPSCLWDPNTVNTVGGFVGVTFGSCKPATQCDLTYQPQKRFESAATFVAAPPTTKCVRSVSQCSQRNFDGVPSRPNPKRGIGCTNHGQCGVNQYCFSCAKCVGPNCGACNSGIPASGMCGPAYRCPIDNDSISSSCPDSSYSYPPVVIPPATNSYCNRFSGCSSCTAAYGCIWSGNSCFFSSIPCSGYGCANTPDQCYNTPYFPPYYPPIYYSASFAASSGAN